MSRSVTAILYSPGTNCHEETAAAIEFAGGRTELVLLRDLLDGRVRLRDYQAAVIPGGFSYGDHLGAGRIFATMLVRSSRCGMRFWGFTGRRVTSRPPPSPRAESFCAFLRLPGDLDTARESRLTLFQRAGRTARFSVNSWDRSCLKCLPNAI